MNASADYHDGIAEPHEALPRRFREPPGRGRVLLPALFVWGLTAAALHLPYGPAIMWWVSSGAALAVLLWWVLRRRRARGLVRYAAIGLSILVCVSASLMIHSSDRQAAILDSAVATHTPATLTIQTTSYPRSVKQSERGSWLRAVLTTGATPAPLLVFVDALPPQSWALGTQLSVTALVRPAAMYEPHSYTLNVSAVRPLSVTTAGESPLATFGRVLSEWAAGLRAGIEHLAQRIPGAELVPGFAVGATNGIPSALNVQLTELSLTHLTAVSGANCALVTGAALWLLQWCRIPRRLRIAAAGMSLYGFALIVGPDASIQRATVMSVIVLISQFSGHAASAYPALGFALALLLVADPWNALSAGFALSVSATLGILLAATPLTDWFTRRVHLPQAILIPLSLTLTAQCACTPILLLLQDGISLLGIIANTVVGPVAPVITLLGGIATLVNPWCPALATALVHLAALPSRWVTATAEVLTGLQLPRLPWPGEWVGVCLWLVSVTCVAVGVLLYRGHRVMRPPPQIIQIFWAPQLHNSQAMKQCGAALCAVGLGIVASVTVVTPMTVGVTTPRDWSVVACDVGQGDAVLIRSPDYPEQTILIDTGNQPDLLRQCLQRFHVSRIELLILSHDDDDHVGALPEVVTRIDEALIAPESATQVGKYRPVVDQLSESDVPYSVGTAGLRLELNRALSLEVLAPLPGQVPRDTNAASQLIMVTVNNQHILLMGDSGEKEQKELFARYPKIRADVLKVAHHGSADQYGLLTQNLEASWALISVGQSNTYGHPARSTLTDLQRAESHILRTDQNGSVALRLIKKESASDPPKENWVPWVSGGREHDGK